MSLSGYILILTNFLFPFWVSAYLYHEDTEVPAESCYSKRNTNSRRKKKKEEKKNKKEEGLEEEKEKAEGERDPKVHTQSF